MLQGKLIVSSRQTAEETKMAVEDKAVQDAARLKKVIQKLRALFRGTKSTAKAHNPKIAELKQLLDVSPLQANKKGDSICDGVPSDADTDIDAASCSGSSAAGPGWDNFIDGLTESAVDLLTQAPERGQLDLEEALQNLRSDSEAYGENMDTCDSSAQTLLDEEMAADDTKDLHPPIELSQPEVAPKRHEFNSMLEGPSGWEGSWQTWQNIVSVSLARLPRW